MDSITRAEREEQIKRNFPGRTWRVEREIEGEEFLISCDKLAVAFSLEGSDDEFIFNIEGVETGTPQDHS